MKNKNNLIIGVIVALVIGVAAGFFGGMQYQKSQSPSFAGFNGQGRQGGQFGQRFGGTNGANRPVTGEILSNDGKSITVKLTDGSSKIVLISDKTAINKADKATVSDLKKGEKVAAFGTTNSDGSITAVSIQLNPQERMFQRPSGTPAQQ